MVRETWSERNEETKQKIERRRSEIATLLHGSPSLESGMWAAFRHVARCFPLCSTRAAIPAGESNFAFDLNAFRALLSCATAMDATSRDKLKAANQSITRRLGIHPPDGNEAALALYEMSVAIDNITNPESDLPIRVISSYNLLNQAISNSLFAWDNSRQLSDLYQPVHNDFRWDNFNKLSLIELFPRRDGHQDNVVSEFESYLASQSEFDFWKRFWRNLNERKILDFEMLIKVVFIPDADWELGAAHIAGKILEIEKSHALSTSNRRPTKNELSTAKNRLAINRDTIVTQAASLTEQIIEYRERVRASNSLEPDLKDELLAFLDSLHSQISQLLCQVPEPGDAVTDQHAEETASWSIRFWATMKSEAGKYVEPENLAQAGVPTAIILGCTGLGTALGIPVAGAIVGGLITNQTKPGQAAKDLFGPKPTAPE